MKIRLVSIQLKMEYLILKAGNKVPGRRWRIELEQVFIKLGEEKKRKIKSNDTC